MMRIMRLLLTFVAAACASCACALGAEPDWPQVEKHALEFLQQYVRIQTVNPPADTPAAAALFQAELEKNGLAPKLYNSGPDGQTNLVVRLPGRDRRKSRCCC